MTPRIVTLLHECVESIVFFALLFVRVRAGERLTLLLGGGYDFDLTVFRFDGRSTAIKGH